MNEFEIPYVTQFYDTETGRWEKRDFIWTIHDSELLPNDTIQERLDFFWTEHNYGCDCNRYELAGWKDDPPCNTDENKVRVKVTMRGIVTVDDLPDGIEAPEL